MATLRDKLTTESSNVIKLDQVTKVLTKEDHKDVPSLQTRGIRLVELKDGRQVACLDTVLDEDESTEMRVSRNGKWLVPNQGKIEVTW